MPRLAALIPSHFARDVASEGFVDGCAGLLEKLEGADDLAGVGSVLAVGAGALAGPAAFIALYAGGALLQWKRDRGAKREARARFRQLRDSLGRIEAMLVDRREMQTIERELDDRFREDTSLRDRFGDAEGGGTQAIATAVAQTVDDALRELAIDESFDGVRIYLSNISDWIVEIDRKQDQQLDNQQLMLQKLAEMDQRLKQSGDTTPELTDADRALLAEARAHGDAKAKARAAIMQRDFEAADPLIEEVTRRAASELFDALTLKGDRHHYAGEFDDAIEPYEKAMELRPDAIGARNNVAIAHNQSRLGSIDAHQRRAIEVYEGTLKRVPERSFEWAMTQNNLGNAYSHLPTGDRAANLSRAIAAYESALDVRTREAHPADWAMTQNNLGNAYFTLPTGDRAANLSRAITAYESALEVRTREAHPADWAMTQNNLGVALADFAEVPGEDRCALLRRSIASSKGALTVRTESAFPHEHADTAHNLAIDRKAYEAAGCSPPFGEIPPAV